ncbi:thioredoxin trx1 [Aspergillus fumigatus]
MASGSIAELMTDEEYKQKVQNSVEPVVVTFLSPPDDKCKAVVSKIEEMSDEYPNIKFYLVDVRKHTTLSRALPNRGLPIVAFVKNGRDVLTLASDVSIPRIREGLQALQTSSI